MNTNRVIALSSAAAFGTQVVFALITLRLFSPQEVGEFSVISQIGFFWMTLALAQSQLGLLANQHLSAQVAAQQAWRASAWRGLALLPIAALAVWFSQLALWPALLWAMLLAFCQMGWMLAQSLTLRAGSAWQQAAVRALPPVTAVATALTATLAGTALGWHGPILLLSALLGYAVGAAWLVPALRRRTTHSSEIAPPAAERVSSDPRSAALRMAHTLVDALLATAIIVVWQRLYGAEETGWMSALLRVLGFVPALVHMAWAQVALVRNTQSTHIKPHAWWLGLAAFACVALLGLSCALALDQGWLAPRWQGVQTYIAPLVLWQGCACLSAAFSDRPFQTQSASQYSQYCILTALVQLFVLISPVALAFSSSLTPGIHISIFAFTSSIGLLCISIWMSKLKS